MTGYVVMTTAAVLGVLSLESFLAFMAVAVGLGVLLSTSALLLEELSFRCYPRARDVLILAAVAVFENLGYRQLTAFWRLQALIGWLARREVKWGVMKRRATWLEKG